MKISECIAPDSVEIDLTAPSKARLLQTLSEKAGRALNINEREIFSALQHRETLGSTGIGAGIAIPHAPIAGLTKPFGLIARLGKPLEFDSIDGVPVDVVCVVLSPPAGGGSHLTVLAQIARLLRSPETLKKIRGATSKGQLYAVIKAAET